MVSTNWRQQEVSVGNPSTWSAVLPWISRFRLPQKSWWREGFHFKPENKKDPLANMPDTWETAEFILFSRSHASRTDTTQSTKLSSAKCHPASPAASRAL